MILTLPKLNDHWTDPFTNSRFIISEISVGHYWCGNLGHWKGNFVQNVLAGFKKQI